jgi:hypothetical protein
MKFRVHVCRIAYRHLDIEVEAKDQTEAMSQAELEAGLYSFPTERAKLYEAQSAIDITPHESEKSNAPGKHRSPRRSDRR